jgi:hypothetical protein
LGRHVHLAWLTEDAFSAPYAQNGYVNPLDSIPLPALYDETMFGNVASGIGGVLFLNDATHWQFIPQTSTFGVIEAVLHVFSAANGDISRDSCGVRRISYRVARQDPYAITDAFSPVPSFNWHTIFDMSYFLPDTGVVDKFGAVYNATSPSHYENRYTATNCGVCSIGTNCLDNVWTGDYDRAGDWAAGSLCSGAWDTRLGNSYNYQIANHHANAMFFDGRYAIQAEAVSQGSLDSETRLLSAVDVLQPETEANIQGVVVDNYYPYVEEVVVYQIPDFRILCRSKWHMNAFNTPESGMALSNDSIAYLPFGQNEIGVAVKYSEAMSTTLGDIKLRTESGEEITWKSSAYFRPVPWNQSLGVQPSYSTDNGAFWQCYETRGFNHFEYSGRIQLCINAVSGASDLAGHYIDSNPETVVYPRDEISGDWNLDNYETEAFDLSNIWGTAHSFSKITNTEYVGWCFDRMVTVDVPSQYSPSLLLGDCDYFCGFWLFQILYSRDESDIARVVAVNGATESTVLYEIPKQYSVLDSGIPGEGDPPCSWVEDEVWQGDFVWLSVHDVCYNPSQGDSILGSSSGSLVCVNAKDGVVLDTQVTNNSWWSGSRGSRITFWGSLITSVVAETDTSVSVTYWNSTGVNGVGETLTKVYEQPSPQDIIFSQRDTEYSEEAIVSGDNTTGTISLASNPCRGNLAILLDGYDGEQFQINMFDLMGRSVYEDRQTCHFSFLLLDTATLSVGVYMLRLLNEDHSTFFKVMVQ